MPNGNGHRPVSGESEEETIRIRQGIINRCKRKERRQDRPMLTAEELPPGYFYCQECLYPVFILPEDRIEGETPQYCEGCRSLQAVPLG